MVDMNYGYIYKTTNLINGRIYIGQHKGTFTTEYLGSGRIIEKAIIKYGKNNFRLEVLAFATTKEMLRGLEMKFIYEYRQVFGKEFLYNVANGGQGGIHSEEHQNKLNLSHTGKRQSDETQRKRGLSLSVALKGKIPPNKGKPMSEEQKIKLSKVMKSNYEQGLITPWSKGTKGICKAWNKTSSSIKCEVCEKVIHRKPFSIKRSVHHYCSNECRTQEKHVRVVQKSII